MIILCGACNRKLENYVTTATATGVLATRATLNSNVDNDFSVTILERGFVYSLVDENDDPKVNGGDEVTKVVIPGGALPNNAGEGPFSATIEDLLPGLDYIFKAYATTAEGTDYSPNKTFTTIDLEVYDATSSNVTGTTATLGGEILITNSGLITERGVVYALASVNDDPKIGGTGVSQEVAGTLGDGVFTVNVAGLTPGAAYAFKAYASIGTDTVYSETGYFPESVGTSLGVDGAFVAAVAPLPNGGMIVGGQFDDIDGEPLKNLARLKADGSVDDTFTPFVEYGTFDASVNAIAVQKDGKIIIGGVFYQIDGHFAGPSIARLNPDGTRDETFNASTDYGIVQCLAIQPDGKILVGGAFASGGLNGNTRYQYIGRLNANGTLDTTFMPAPNTGPNSFVESIAIQEDGKILISGTFWEYNGVAQARFARISNLGALDTGFTPDCDAYHLALQADGQILISSYNPAGAGSTYGLHRVEESNGDLDPTFATSTGSTGGAFTDEKITSIAVQADGKILIAGEFTEVDGTPRSGVARINTTGTLDNSFNPTFAYSALGVALKNDGLVPIVGRVDPYVPGVYEDLIEFAANDPASESLTATSSSRVEWMRGGAAPEVSQVEFEISTNSGASWSLLGPGVRIVGGWELTGLSLPGVADYRVRGRTTSGKLNGSSGLVEKSTVVGGGPSGNLPTITNLTTPVIGGIEATLGAEVTDDGGPDIITRGIIYTRSIDDRDPRLGDPFISTVAALGTIGAFTIEADGLVNGTTYSFRAYATNAVGTAYSEVGTFETNGAPRIENKTLDALTDTSVILGAEVTSTRGSNITERGVLIRRTNGDALSERFATAATASRFFTGSGGLGTFTVAVGGLIPGTEYEFVPFATNGFGTSYVSPQGRFTTTGVAPSAPEGSSPGGELLSSGNAVEAEGDPAGTLDGEFGTALPAESMVQCIAHQTDGKLIVAGAFRSIGGTPKNGLARLNADGSLDPSFTAITNGLIYSVVVQPDGKILLGGVFTEVNGATRNGVARLEADGSLESPLTFSPGSGADNLVFAVSVQADGKILLGGLFEKVQGVTRNRVARLNPNGSLDTSFDPGVGPNNSVFCLSALSDGTVVIGGAFTNVSGTPCDFFARLNSTGSFLSGGGPDARVSAFLVQPDGKILMSGSFTNFNGTPSSRIVRLNAIGTIDASFIPGTGANGDVNTLALQTDGKIFIGGQFTGYNGTARNRIARINADGTLDASFDPLAGPDADVEAIALVEDGDILVGGSFENFAGIANNALARLENDAATGSLSAVDGTQINWLRGGAGPAVRPVEFELSTDAGLTWVGLGTGTKVAGGWSLTGENLPLAGMVRAFGQTTGGFLGGSSGLVEEIAVFDHGAIVAGLQAKLAAANANVAKIQKQIKAAKKKKDAAKVKKLNKSLKTASAQVAKAKADLSKY